MSGSEPSMRERLLAPPVPRAPHRERRAEGDHPEAQLRALLNPDQLHRLKAIESFGWRLAFVRKPLFQDVIPVVESADGRQRCVMDAIGQLEPGTVVQMR